MTGKYNIAELFTYRLHVLKKQTDRTMSEAFEAALSLSLTEARLLLSVGAFGSLSVSDLGRVSNLDRSQASRATDVLERKGLLAKTSNDVLEETASYGQRIGDRRQSLGNVDSSATPSREPGRVTSGLRHLV